LSKTYNLAKITNGNAEHSTNHTRSSSNDAEKDQIRVNTEENTEKDQNIEANEMSPKLVENGQHSEHSDLTNNVQNGNESKNGKFQTEFSII